MIVWGNEQEQNSPTIMNPIYALPPKEKKDRLDSTILSHGHGCTTAPVHSFSEDMH